jgi:hypothetical protein
MGNLPFSGHKQAAMEGFAPDNDTVFWLIWLPLMVASAVIIYLLIRRAQRAKIKRRRETENRNS